MNGALRNALFDGLPDSGDIVDTALRPHQQMNVLRHKDVGPKFEVPPLSRPVQLVEKHSSYAVAIEQRQAAKTGERQLMRIARSVVRPPGLPRGLRIWGALGPVHARTGSRIPRVGPARTKTRTCPWHTIAPSPLMSATLPAALLSFYPLGGRRGCRTLQPGGSPP